MLLKNLTLLINNKQSGLAVKVSHDYDIRKKNSTKHYDVQGNVTLENCTMRGACLVDGTKNGEKDVGSWKGFYIAPKGKLYLKGCNVINFDVGLRVRAGGQVVLSHSEISSCNIGILVISL